jgi:hypothetical protein
MRPSTSARWEGRFMFQNTSEKENIGDEKILRMPKYKWKKFESVMTECLDY